MFGLIAGMGGIGADLLYRAYERHQENSRRSADIQKVNDIVGGDYNNVLSGYVESGYDKLLRENAETVVRNQAADAGVVGSNVADREIAKVSTAMKSAGISNFLNYQLNKEKLAVSPYLTDLTQQMPSTTGLPAVRNLGYEFLNRSIQDKIFNQNRFVGGDKFKT